MSVTEKEKGKNTKTFIRLQVEISSGNGEVTKEVADKIREFANSLSGPGSGVCVSCMDTTPSEQIIKDLQDDKF